jgi:hypothetical protein
MKYFLIKDHLSSDKFHKILDFANDHTGETITWIISCGGGEMALASVFIDLVNSDKENHVIIGSYLYSAAFFIFYNAQCKKKLVSGTVGMFHYPYQKMETTENGKHYYDQDRAMTKNNEEFGRMNTYQWCVQFMTEEELTRFEIPEDVFFTFPRMQQIFPDVETI